MHPDADHPDGQLEPSRPILPPPAPEPPTPDGSPVLGLVAAIIALSMGMLLAIAALANH